MNSKKNVKKMFIYPMKQSDYLGYFLIFLELSYFYCLLVLFLNIFPPKKLIFSARKNSPSPILNVFKNKLSE